MSNDSIKIGNFRWVICIDGHTRVSWAEMFDRYFSLDDPLATGSDFSRFSAEEQKNIKNGTLAEGMSKAVVLMAYGYPPAHKTPDLNSSVWVYLKNRWRIVLVSFKNGKVSEIHRGSVEGAFDDIDR